MRCVNNYTIVCVMPNIMLKIVNIIVIKYETKLYLLSEVNESFIMEFFNLAGPSRSAIQQIWKQLRSIVIITNFSSIVISKDSTAAFDMFI